jgi:hypothetical protein
VLKKPAARRRISIKRADPDAESEKAGFPEDIPELSPSEGEEVCGGSFADLMGIPDALDRSFL